MFFGLFYLDNSFEAQVKRFVTSTYSPIYEAIEREQLEVLEEILAKQYIKPNTHLGTLEGPLCMATLAYRWGGVALLLDYGWDPNAKFWSNEEVGALPLRCALMSNYNMPLVRLLFLYNADINLKEESSKLSPMSSIRASDYREKRMKLVTTIIEETKQFNEIKQQADQAYSVLDSQLTTIAVSLSLVQLKEVARLCQAVAVGYIAFANKEDESNNNPKIIKARREIEQFYRRKALDYYDKALQCLNLLCFNVASSDREKMVESYRGCLDAIFSTVLNDFEEPVKNQVLRKKLADIRAKARAIHPQPLDMLSRVNLLRETAQGEDTTHERSRLLQRI